MSSEVSDVQATAALMARSASKLLTCAVKSP
jgi:hypothetical protein